VRAIPSFLLNDIAIVTKHLRCCLGKQAVVLRRIQKPDFPQRQHPAPQPPPMDKSLPRLFAADYRSLQRLRVG
jgi:hypothetical protein